MMDTRGGGGGSDPTHPKKTTKLHCSGTPGNSQSHQDSIQCWASIGLQAKPHLNGSSLAGR